MAVVCSKEKTTFPFVVNFRGEVTQYLLVVLAACAYIDTVFKCHEQLCCFWFWSCNPIGHDTPLGYTPHHRWTGLRGVPPVQQAVVGPPVPPLGATGMPWSAVQYTNDCSWACFHKHTRDLGKHALSPPFCCLFSVRRCCVHAPKAGPAHPRFSRHHIHFWRPVRILCLIEDSPLCISRFELASELQRLLLHVSPGITCQK